MTQRELFENLSESASLGEVQGYIKEVIALRGFGGQPVQEELLLLTEEVGELAKAIRKSATSMSVDTARLHNYDSVESEVADVFIVLMSICNTLGISLFDSLIEKERENIDRHWSAGK